MMNNVNIFLLSLNQTKIIQRQFSSVISSSGVFSDQDRSGKMIRTVDCAIWRIEKNVAGFIGLIQ